MFLGHFRVDLRLWDEGPMQPVHTTAFMWEEASLPLLRVPKREALV